MSNPTTPTFVDPFDAVRIVLDLLREHGHRGPYTGRELGDAAVCGAALIAALGTTPAVEGDVTDPRCAAGLALLDVLRSTYRPRYDDDSDSGPGWPMGGDDE